MKKEVDSEEKKTGGVEAARWVSLADRLNPNRAAFDPDFQKEWKIMDKASKKSIIEEDRRKIREFHERAAKPLPFETDANDHCETSKTAYAHAAPLLHLLAKRLKKAPEDLLIYDPYYCAGTVRKHLGELGFHRVHNQPDDFYDTIAKNRIPPHDVLVTNPPYSGDHFSRLKTFLSRHPVPHLLLIPDHFEVSLSMYTFLKPKERYHYWTPQGMRPKEDAKKRKHRNLVLGSRNSPFPSRWCVCLEPVLSKKKLLRKAKPAEGSVLQGDETANEGAKFRPGDTSSIEPPSKKRKQQKKKKKKKGRVKHDDS